MLAVWTRWRLEHLQKHTPGELSEEEPPTLAKRQCQCIRAEAVGQVVILYRWRFSVMGVAHERGIPALWAGQVLQGLIVG